MALATTCPQCTTSFKVVPDQLKLRRGLVRCGVCQHVFSGIDYLRYVDESKRAEPELPDASPWQGGEALQTAFFLPETILAAAQAPGEGSGHAPASDVQPAGDVQPASDVQPAAGEPGLPGETGPAEGITDDDLLGFSIDDGSLPSRSDRPVASMPIETGDWLGIEIDWSRPAEAVPAPSPAPAEPVPETAPAPTAEPQGGN